MNWDKGKVAAKIFYPDPATLGTSNVTYKDHILKLPSRVHYKISYNFVPYGGLNMDNQDYYEQPVSIEFTIGIPGTSNSYRLLRALQTSKLQFNIEVFDQLNSGQFAIVNDVLIGCKILSRDVRVVPGGLPMTIFAGIALRHTYSDPVDVNGGIRGNGSTTDPTLLFGSGTPVQVDLFKEWK